tara:strand:+ start:171 stop:407 length:237 start_codon:yes stop_codon:yes gene_type:complete
MQEISKNIHQNIKKLELGELSLSELEFTTNQTKELYERLIILRYKYYEEHSGNKKHKKRNKKSEKKEDKRQQSIVFEL